MHFEFERGRSEGIFGCHLRRSGKSSTEVAGLSPEYNRRRKGGADTPLWSSEGNLKPV